MKKHTFRIIITLLIIALGLVILPYLSRVNAASNQLNAGAKISLQSFNKNLDNINIKIEFTTNVNLDGANNALLVGIISNDETLLTDQRFIGSSTLSGLYDEDDTVLVLENAPSTIGTKVKNGGYYTYTFETKDFTVVDSTTNVGYFVVIAQKGTLINVQLSVTEVKYSVRFGEKAPVLYSYNELIEAPETTYFMEINGHYPLNSWVGDDSSEFIEGSTYTTKDIVYRANKLPLQAHNWEHIDEDYAIRGHNGVLAHDICSICGAIRIDNNSQSLSNTEDLNTTHICEYDVSFDWSNALNPGDKPHIIYICQDELCGYSYKVNSSDIVMTIKDGSLIEPTFDKEGSVIYVASTTYENKIASDEKSYILPKSTHKLTFIEAVLPTCTTDGNVQYFHCNECGKNFSDIEAKYELLSIIDPRHHSLTHIDKVDSTCTINGIIEHYHCSVCNKNFGDEKGINEINDINICAHHNLTHIDKVDETCTTDGRIECYHCTICDKNYSDSLGQIEIFDVRIPKHHNLIYHDGVEASCTTGGNIDYYECLMCGKCFSDISAQNELDTTSIKPEHLLTHHDAKEATCIEDGNIEYYECSKCHKLFSDSEGTKVLSSVILKGGHIFTHYNKVDATCTTEGNIEYYHCSVCGKNFDKESNKLDSVIIPATHSLIKYIATDATCETDGNIEYYHCSVCGKNFRDQGGKLEVEDIVIHAIGHQYGTDGRCTVCGKNKPNQGGSGCFSVISSFSLLPIFAASFIIIVKKKKENNVE